MKNITTGSQDDTPDGLPDDSPASMAALVGAAPGQSADDADKREKVGKATFAITALHMTGRLAGFVEGMLVAHLAGGKGTTDAYFAASKVPQGIFGFGESLLTHSFLPPFVAVREKHGEATAWRLASLVATIQAIILVLAVVLGEIYAPGLVHSYTRKFDPQSAQLTVNLVRVMLPAVIMMSLASLTYVILNAYKEFAIPAFGDTALKIGIVICGFGLWHFLGGIKAFAVGLVLGAFFKIAVHLLGLGKKTARFRPTLNFKTPGAGRLVALMIPLMVSNILGTVRPFIDTWFCGAKGQVSALNFAFKLTNLPFFLVPYALSIALFPFLAEMATRGDRKQIGRALVSALRMVTFLLVPVTAVYLVMALPMIEAVYKGGLFTQEDASRVVPPLVWYTLGMLPLAFETVILQIFFALSDTFVPMLIAYGTFLVYLGVGYGSSVKLGWGAAGVALAILASKGVKDIILLGVLVPRLKGLNLAGLSAFLAKMAAATVVMVIVLWGSAKVFFPEHLPATVSSGPVASSPASPAPHAASAPVESSDAPTASAGAPTSVSHQAASPTKKNKSKGGAGETIKKLLKFAFGAAPGLLAFVLMAYWLGIEEFHTFYNVLNRRLGPIFRKLARASMARW